MLMFYQPLKKWAGLILQVARKQESGKSFARKRPTNRSSQLK